MRTNLVRVRKRASPTLPLAPRLAQAGLEQRWTTYSGIEAVKGAFREWSRVADVVEQYTALFMPIYSAAFGL